MSDSRIREAIELMTGFAERSGLSSERPQQRYLWTDAFAVCNFLGLSRMTGEKRYTELALRLVDRDLKEISDGAANAGGHLPTL